MREELDGVGRREGGGGLWGCRSGKEDGDDMEEGEGLGSVFRLSALSSTSGRCSLALRRSCKRQHLHEASRYKYYSASALCTHIYSVAVG